MIFDPFALSSLSYISRMNSGELQFAQFVLCANPRFVRICLKICNKKFNEEGRCSRFAKLTWAEIVPV